MKDTIKLCLFGSFPPPYHGSSLYLQEFSKLLKSDTDFEIYQVNTSNNNNSITNLGKINFNNSIAAIRGLINLLGILLKKKPEILYIPIAQNKAAFFRDGLALVLSRLFTIKVIIHLHGSFFKEFYDKSGWLYKRFVDSAMHSCSVALVLGERLKPIFSDWFPSQKIISHPNFINDIYGLNNKERNDSINLLYLSNIVQSKGIFELLEAVVQIKELMQNRKVVLKIIGKFGKDPTTGISEEDTCLKINKYIIQNREIIDLLGPIYELDLKKKHLQESDIFVFPTWYPIEGQPLSIIEAMSVGLPVISTKNVGAIEETVIDGFNGILVEKKNVDQLAEAITKLISDDELRIRMGKNSRLRYESEYTPEIHLKRFKEIINHVLSS